MNPAAVRAGLKTNLSAIKATQVSAYLLSNPSPPTLMVMAGPTQFDQAMGRGVDRWTLVVQGITGLASDQSAQQKLDEWRRGSGATSVKAAIESDKTLGGTCQNLLVTQVSGDNIYSPDGKGPYLGCEWTVEVLGTGG